MKRVGLSLTDKEYIRLAIYVANRYTGVTVTTFSKVATFAYMELLGEDREVTPGELEQFRKGEVKK